MCRSGRIRITCNSCLVPVSPTQLASERTDSLLLNVSNCLQSQRKTSSVSNKQETLTRLWVHTLRVYWQIVRVGQADGASAPCWIPREIASNHLLCWCPVQPAGIIVSTWTFHPTFQWVLGFRGKRDSLWCYQTNAATAKEMWIATTFTDFGDSKACRVF